ncbi:MAG: hypothetical protein RSB41_01655 [Bacilli bacterium]
MENRINQVMLLGDGRKYFVVKQVVYKTETYFVCLGVKENEEDFTDEISLIKEVKNDKGEAFAEKVTDPKVLETIFSNIKF